MNRPANFFAKALEMLQAIREVAASVEGHRAPSTRSLNILGIPEKQFRAIKH
ncbi:hypothetical protein JJJ17_16070 [Paracoccus caeni]|uniref:Uncharacterized protein n=1 Tax=Paracoccus caeni TaxID=657651 RepID=A0A934SEK2_9RHOB|nr:hypothetical protein [Paracoccus caeni]MBK4217446.1 hypothetical protein [Paracoccus caeni]